MHDDINDNVYIIMEEREREREDRKKRDRVKEREVLKNDFFLKSVYRTRNRKPRSINLFLYSNICMLSPLGFQ